MAESELQAWYESGRDRVVPRDPPEPPPNWLRYAVAFCRNEGDGLARYFKVVPAAYVTAETVTCRCGTVVAVPDREFVQCPGGCRWFVRDGEIVWAARLPVDEPAAA